MAARDHRHARSSLRRRVSGVVVAAAVLLTSACGLSSPAASTGPIVIGMSLPLTGPVADRSKPGREGYEYWADEINAHGGLLGRQVQLKILDDGFDQQTAISDYNRLIDRKSVV